MIMPNISADAVFISTVIVAFVAVLAMRPWRELRLIVLAVILLASWALLVQRTGVEVAESNRKFEERTTSGEDVPMKETLADGTGDNAAALICGWMPTTLGGLLAFGVGTVLRHRRKTSPSSPC